VTSSDSQRAPDLFVTETMAELSARQGRTADAIAIYRSLLGGAGPGDERRTRWTTRLAALESGGVAPADVAAPAPVAAAAPVPRDEGAPTGQTEPALQLPLVVRQPVRSGQIVYAQGTDLIVLAAVNPGAQLLADGNIHVYAPLRGRAIAGARGNTAARIFSTCMEPQLVAIAGTYRTTDTALPADVLGKPAQVRLDGETLVVEALPG